jgi:hypothetical protein
VFHNARQSTRLSESRIASDTGTKLSDSPITEVDTRYVLSSGTHTLIVPSMSVGTFQVLNKSQVTITVS